MYFSPLHLQKLSLYYTQSHGISSIDLLLECLFIFSPINKEGTMSKHQETHQEENQATQTEGQETQSVQPENEDLLSQAQARISELEAQLAEAQQAAVQKEQELQLRARAEMDNIRRRAAQDVEKAHKFALEKFGKDLLETIDNLERALQTPTDHAIDNAKAVLDGVSLTLQGFLKTVEQYGIKAVGEVGDAFNPDLHHAIKQEKVDGMDSNKITNVLQKGYTLNGRVIRPAMVMISE